MAAGDGSPRRSGGEASAGIDAVDQVRALERPIPGIWTNRIDRIAPLVRAQQP